MTDLSSMGEATGGNWTRKQSLSLLKPSQIRSRLLDGEWQAPWPGVYADNGHVLDALQEGYAAVLASCRRTGEVDAVLCMRSAARGWGMPLIDDDDPTTGANQRLHHDVSTGRHLPDLRSVPLGAEDPSRMLHRYQLALSEDEVVEVSPGLSSSTRVRTLLDLAAVVSHEALVCAIDHQLQGEHVTLAELEKLAEERKGLVWAPAFRRALEVADAGAESPAETLARLILKPSLPGLRTQVKVFDDGAVVVARLDLADEDLMLAVESDGKRGHAGDAMAVKDRRRDAITGAKGWWTERVTWYELRREPDKVLRRLLARAARRRSA
jgi:very-short-patch-repair endonuclease